jgi:hypothetical protein
VPLEQPGRPGGLPGGQGVAHGVVGQAMLLLPGGGVAVQRRHPLGPLARQTGAEQVGEQLVVAPPATHLVQRD